MQGQVDERAVRHTVAAFAAESSVGVEDFRACEVIHVERFVPVGLAALVTAFRL